MLGLARRWLGLPPRRFRAHLETHWVALSDGVRLATSVARPRADTTVPAVLIRTAEAAHARSHPVALFARVLAEGGYAVVTQECRGRHASEGEFTPFEREASDGAEAVDWVLAQPWCDGRLGLVGVRYGAHAAFAAAARSPGRVGALVAAFGARDPYAMLFAGGALRLDFALHFAAAHSERGHVATRRIDLARGTRFRPLREADRVALRRVDWFREWLDHPARDAFWSERTPPLPSPALPTLLLAGWSDPALAAQLADHAALAGAAREGGGVPPELVVGPWLAARGPEGALQLGGRGALVATLRETAHFLDRHLGGGAPARPAVRIFVAGGKEWREAVAWPIPEAGEQGLFLHSAGNAQSFVGDGRLDAEAPGPDEKPDSFRYDPADPVPALVPGLDARAVEARADLLCYTSAPLREPLGLAGPVRLELFAASSAPDTDFTARLLAVTEDGEAKPVCEGITRCRWRQGGDTPRWLEPDRPERLVVDLGAAARLLPAGARLRLEISSSCSPRFDRNGNVKREPAQVTREECAPARQTVHHDAEYPSRLVLTTWPVDREDGGPAGDAGGPAEDRNPGA